MRTLIAIAVVIIPAAAWADYAEHMKAGDAFENKSKWKDALKEFEAALADKPGDARALVEVGWAACMIGNVARAREASEAALDATTDFKLRGAALFNLGVSWEKDDPFAAASLEFAGYVLRPNPTVAARLAKLEKSLKKGAAAGKAKDLIAKRKIDALPKPSRDGTYHAPIDDAFVVAMQRAGASFIGIGMMKEQLDVTKLTCVESLSATECTGTTEIVPDAKPFNASGENAHAIVENLKQRKINGKPTGGQNKYTTTLQCRLYTEQDNGSDLACSITSP